LLEQNASFASSLQMWHMLPGANGKTGETESRGLTIVTHRCENVDTSQQNIRGAQTNQKAFSRSADRRKLRLLRQLQQKLQRHSPCHECEANERGCRVSSTIRKEKFHVT
jgi:hypothetical protein